MRNKELKKITSSLVLAIMILSFPAFTFAGDSASIRIGCVIPAIPGVNIPLVEESAAIQKEAEETEIKQATPDLPSMFQKDEEIIRLNNGKETFLKVKTVYSR
jgi:hypothetical protein